MMSVSTPSFRSASSRSRSLADDAAAVTSAVGSTTLILILHPLLLVRGTGWAGSVATAVPPPPDRAARSLGTVAYDRAWIGPVCRWRLAGQDSWLGHPH